MPSALEIAIKQIESARAYTLELLKDVDDKDWFRIPSGAVSHVGWQVGHLYRRRLATLARCISLPHW